MADTGGYDESSGATAPLPPAGPGSRPAQYYVQMLGQETGPYSAAELQIMVRSGQIKYNSLVRLAEGAWFPAQQLPGLFSDKSWTMALILSIFLGELGIDRFYLGHVGLGILKLITFGGCGIWWLIDLILIAMRKVPDGDGLPLGN